MNADIKSVEFQGVEFSYADACVFKSVNLQLPENAIVQVIGGMGLGKSAFLKLCAGLLLPTQGQVAINQNPISEMSFEEFLPWRLRIGYGFDAGGLLNNRSVFENLALPLEYHKLLSPDEIKVRVQGLLQRFDLQGVKTKRPAEISSSQRKAASVARALVLEPQMLILDDPTTSLDARAKKELMEWMAEKIKSRILKFVVISGAEEIKVPGIPTQFLEVKREHVVWLKQNRVAA